MELKFIQVTNKDQKYIDEIFKILQKSGEYMFREKGLTHWLKPYSKKNIKNDTINRKVYLVKNISNGDYVCTFQLESKRGTDGEERIEINKFSTSPKQIGKGIGTRALTFIEDNLTNSRKNVLILEVYEKSIDAIKFYEAKGFKRVGSRQTTNFRVILMKKSFI